MLITNIKQYISSPIKGAIHIGAHHAQEIEWYLEYNINSVIWIECNEQYIPIIKNKIKTLNNHQVITACIGNKTETKTFYIANNGQSSSFLEFGSHKYLHPDVSYINQIDLETIRMADLIQAYDINIKQYNFLNIDIQGYELEALKSFDNYINHIDYIYTEINTDYVYKNYALISEVDAYLKQYNFIRKTTKLYNQWGDAFYSRL